MRLLKTVTVICCGLVLCACHEDRNRAEASCQLDVRHFYEMHPQGNASSAMSSVDMKLCMRKHGYRVISGPPCPTSFDGSPPDFDLRYWNATHDPRCYVPAGPVAKMWFSIENWIGNPDAAETDHP